MSWEARFNTIEELDSASAPEGANQAQFDLCRQAVKAIVASGAVPVRTPDPAHKPGKVLRDDKLVDDDEAAHIDHVQPTIRVRVGGSARGVKSVAVEVSEV